MGRAACFLATQRKGAPDQPEACKASRTYRCLAGKSKGVHRTLASRRFYTCPKYVQKHLPLGALEKSCLPSIPEERLQFLDEVFRDCAVRQQWRPPPDERDTRLWCPRLHAFAFPSHVSFSVFQQACLLRLARNGYLQDARASREDVASSR